MLGILLLIFSTASFYAAFTEFAYSGNIPGVYKSDYFSLLEDDFSIIESVFITQMLYGSDKESPWIALEDIKNKHNIDITFYSFSNIIMPPSVFNGGNSLPENIKDSGESSGFAENGRYIFYKPLIFDGRLAVFFGKKKGFTAGYFRFEKYYKQNIVIGNERKVIFLSIGTLILFFSVILILYNPDKKISKIFTR